VIWIAVPLRPAGLVPRQNLRETVCPRLRFVLGVIAADPVLDSRKEVSSGRVVWPLSAPALHHQQELPVECGVSPAPEPPNVAGALTWVRKVALAADRRPILNSRGFQV